MTLRDYLSALARQWVAILILGLIGGGTAFAYSKQLPLEYRSTASVIVVPERGQSSSDLVQGSTYVQNLVQSYAVLAASPFVLQPVIQHLGLPTTPTDLAKQVTVDTPLNTVVIDISVTATIPEKARDVSDGIASELARAVAQLSPQGSAGKAAVRMTTITPATMPLVPVAPNSKLNALMGLLAGLTLGFAYALVRHFLRNRIVGNEVEGDIGGTPVLGEICRPNKSLNVPSSIISYPSGLVAESFRTLAANLRFVRLEKPTFAILVTSAVAKEGKSSTALGLAMTLAENGQRTLLIDTDLRLPSVADLTQLEGSVGLTDVLVGDVSLAEATQVWGPNALTVLVSGVIPPNAGHLLASDELRRVIDEAKRSFDCVIIDSAPLKDLSDARWLAPVADGILVVARAGSSRLQEVIAVVDSLASARTPVMGIVLTAVKRRETGPYYPGDGADLPPNTTRGRHASLRPNRGRAESEIA